MGLRPSHLFLAAAAFGATLTLVGALGPASLARRDPALHVGLEVVATIVAAIAALLLVGRFRQRGRFGDLVLASALGALALANFAFSAVPSIAADSPGAFATWAAIVARLLGAAAFAASPFLMDRRVGDRRRLITIAFVVTVGVLATIAAAAAGVGARLPAAVASEISTQTFLWTRDAHGAVLAAQLATMALFLVAAVGFTARARRNGDELVRWLGPAAVLAASAYLNYSLFPSVYSSWASVGDVLRLAFYALVFVGAAREVAVYQRERAEAAVLEERRRLARDLHDGLAQELAYLVTQSRLLVMRQPDLTDELEPLAATAQRALDESRLAIAALTRVGYEPLEVAVAAAAEEIAERAGVGVRLELAGGIDVPPELKEAMVRIVREAVTNAVRHGQADEVTVELANGDGIRLAIVDDGTGFDSQNGAKRASGFGLTSMRERAEAMGGRLTVVSEPGVGTRVEVALP